MSGEELPTPHEMHQETWQNLILNIEIRFFDLTKENHYRQIVHMEQNKFTIGNLEEVEIDTK